MVFYSCSDKESATTGSQLGVSNSDTSLNDSIRGLANDLEEMSKPESRDSIPKELLYYIKLNLPDFSIIPIENYNDDWEHYYEEVDHFPYCIAADFNGDEVSDFALLLYKDEKDVNLVVFHANGGNAWDHIIVKNFGSRTRKHIIGLFVEERGRIDGMEKSIDIKNSSISVVWFEKSGSLFYFEEGEYKIFSDFD